MDCKLVICSFDHLAEQWRTEAETLRKRGATAQAVVLESCADEMERALRERDNELLNLMEAAQLSGYSSEHLGRMVRDGKIPNAGRPGAPRIRLGDIPRKARQLPDSTHAMQIADGNRRQVVRAIVGHKKEPTR